MTMQTEFKDFDQTGLDFLANNGRPIPGSSLTNSPDDPYAWEQPPQFTELSPAIDALFLELSEPEAYHSIMDLVRNGVPVGDIAQVILTDGFQKGMFNPDVAELIKPFLAVEVFKIAKINKVKNVVLDNPTRPQDSGDIENLRSLKQDLDPDNEIEQPELTQEDMMREEIENQMLDSDFEESEGFMTRPQGVS